MTNEWKGVTEQMKSSNFTTKMERNLVRTLRYILPVTAIAALAACSSSGDPKPAAQKEEERAPVTMKIGVKKGGYLTDEEFKRFIADPVKKKYPYLTAERIDYDDKLIPEMLASNSVPDIIITNNVNGIPAISEAKLLKPLTEGLKTNGIDLARFEPQPLEAMKAAAQSADLVAIPYTRSFSALYYNKDIFDKFAVPYPKDGMTWQEATDLGKRLTRMDGTTQYRGLEPNVPERMAMQLSLPFVDTKTNRAIVNNELWKKVLVQAAEIYKIPGNEKYAWKTAGINAFTKDRTLAMLADVNIITTARLGELTDLNWDFAAYPTFPEAPGKGMGADLHIMVPTSTSKYPDEAFRVISAVISDEVQLDMAKQGRSSILKDDKYKTAFGQDLPFLKGKNIAAAFKTTTADPYRPSLHDTAAMTVIQAELRNMFQKGKDVNSALRDAEEKINSDIAAKGK
ncbi:ABC transporter substrate-binding protein [Paenibacillus ginsengarvi]|uniref:Extracellular solute-binding protein n=1 Tax=Paenibacillus ginsengarvi TaxID=400777 RepID=A0A3B0CF82_9BACL|nr:extracellular solute-binding protein [Paenibacillus ginsengarvi]RKN83771.1 extracellular solute-binding protein [Paenibacillus ginsengarvi]